MKLKKIYVVEGEMTLESGLHIGGSEISTKIGGCDNPVIKNPITGLPYVPGSSLKGRMRSMLEAKLGKENRGMPCKCGYKTCMVCTLFGAHMNTKAECGPVRLKIGDMNLSQDFLDEISKNPDINIIETKAATMIDRSTGTAFGGSLRNTERVAAGCKFDAKITINIYEGDNEEAIINTIKQCITMVNANGLGAKTSSGSGAVDINMDWKHMVDILA